MIVQLVVVIFVCIAAAVFALTLAGVSLTIFAKFLKRSDHAGEEQKM